MIMEQEVFERMVLEFNELIKRVEACRDFLLDQEKVSKLDPLNRDLLVAQFKAMETYVSLLSIRIGYNSNPEEQPVDTEETVIPEAVND
jgi:hypothetical protein